MKKIILNIVGILILAFSAWSYFYEASGQPHSGRIAAIGGGLSLVGLACIAIANLAFKNQPSNKSI